MHRPKFEVGGLAYLHVYEGTESNKKIVVLEDTHHQYWLAASIEDGPFDSISQLECYLDEKLEYVGRKYI